MPDTKVLAITSVRARRVLGEFDYDLTFPEGDAEGRLRLIYAQNGRGKSNLLRAVASLLTPSPESLQSLIEIPLAELSIGFTDASSVIMFREDSIVGSYSLQMRKPEMLETPSPVVTVDPADFAGRLYRRVWDERKDYTGFVRDVRSVSPGAIYIGDDRLLPQVEEARAVRGESSRALTERRGAVSNLLQTVERMLTRAAISGLSRESSQNGIYGDITRMTLQGQDSLSSSDARAALEEQISDLLRLGAPLEGYGLLSLRQVRDVEAQIEDARANNRQLPVLQRILSPYFESLKDQIEAMQGVHDLIDIYVTAVNKFLDRKSLKFTASTGVSLSDKRGDPLDPESLSSGERHLILLLSQALLATADRPMMLIDEPEISLGIDWQRDLLPEILRCSQSADIQILVASHSLQVMSSAGRENIIEPTESGVS